MSWCTRTADRCTFLRSGGGRLEISPAALEVIHSYIQDTPKKDEAGGVLLGRHLLGSNDIVVDRVTWPMRRDRRQRCRFRRARRRHQAEIDRAWRESHGTCAYLGEWHTHPDPDPHPSSTDRQDWARKLRHDEFTEPIFFVIAGTRAISIWEGWRSGVVMETTPLHMEEAREEIPSH